MIIAAISIILDSLPSLPALPSSPSSLNLDASTFPMRTCLWITANHLLRFVIMQCDLRSVSLSVVRTLPWCLRAMVFVW